MSNNRNRNESTFTKIAVGAAVGAFMGLAAYGIKKVYDEISEEKEQPMRAAACCVVDDDDSDDYTDSHSGRNVQPNTTAAETRQQQSIQHELSSYYRNYCQVPRWEMDRAKEVVDDVKKLFLKFVQEQLSEMRVLALRDTGSAEEGLKVISANEFDVMIHLQLERNVWGMEESDTAPGFWHVRQQGAGPSQVMQKYCSGQHLAPQLIIRRFQSILQKMVNLPQNKYEIRNSVHGPAVTLNVTYNCNGVRKVLDIDFVPSVEIDGTWVVAKPHPRTSSQSPEFEHLWRQSFSMDEYFHLNKSPSLTGHKTCLMIMKAVRLNHYSQLGPLSSYVFKTILLHMLDREEDWSDDDLPERIFDFLIELKQCLGSGELPNYFCPDMNLLEGIQPVVRINMQQFIIKRLDKGIVDLLKTDYKGSPVIQSAI